MTEFQQKRREPLMDEASYRWSIQYKLERGIPKYIESLNDSNIAPDGIRNIRWHLSRMRFSYCLMLYSGGEELFRVKSALVEALDAIEEHLEEQYPIMDEFDFAIQDSYVQALWLLSLTKLLGLGNDKVKQVAELYESDETNEGADDLYELILGKLGLTSKFDAAGVIHEDPYELLLDCIKAEPEDRPSHMAAFLTRWYKGQKECDWWGMHINRTSDPILKTGFFGYWAFEAALVTYLWDIDDRSYRDLPHYPKDLVDYAREHLPVNSQPSRYNQRCEAGQACPREGYWYTPAKANSRRYFKLGDIMPTLQSDFGATIWQWDSSQPD